LRRFAERRVEYASKKTILAAAGWNLSQTYSAAMPDRADALVEMRNAGHSSQFDDGLVPSTVES